MPRLAGVLRQSGWGGAAGEGCGQQIGWEGETVEQLKLALWEPNGLRTSWFFFHIVAIVLQVKINMQAISERENRTLLLHSLNLRRKGHLSGGFNKGDAYVPRYLAKIPQLWL